MRPGLVRFAAPAAFLVAATIAILLIRSVIRDDAAPPSAGATTPTRTQTAGTTSRTTTRASTAGQEHYEIRAGDTLGTVADRFDTTVEALVELNPGVDPTGLQVGQRLRVK